MFEPELLEDTEEKRRLPPLTPVPPNTTQSGKNNRNLKKVKTNHSYTSITKDTIWIGNW